MGHVSYLEGTDFQRTRVLALNMEKTTPPRWIRVSERLPKPGEFVRYRTKDFISAGRCYEDGSWLDSTGKPEVAEVLEWLEQ